MEFDISYLLFLQNIRESTGGVFDEFFNALSKFAVDILPFLGYIIFWSVSKKWGYRFMITLWCGEVINGLLKLIVCAYRPWIRSDKINPAGDSKVAATGYSFPSGHSTVATIHYGTIFAWQRKKRMWLAIVCAVLLFLTCFSRNYLGVHTPQDVFIAICEGVLALILMNRLFSYLEKNPEKEYIFLGIGFVAAWLGIIYITFKGYPMDYSADGKLIVDPQKMMNDGYGDLGKLMGFCAARFIDKKWIKFKPLELNAKSVVICLIGLIPMWAIINYVKAPVVELLGGHWGKLVYAVILVMYCLVVYPLVIKLIGRLTAKKAQ